MGANSEQSDSGLLVGLRVRLSAPGAWFDGYEGHVIREGMMVRGTWTVEIAEPGHPRALVREGEMKIIGTGRRS